MTTIWTHRGDGLENTLLAFDSAWRKGITHFETDLQLTSDNTLILAHDDSIHRLTGNKKRISTLTYQQLQTYPIGGTSNWSSLADLLHNFPKAHISIDLKTDATVPALLDLLQQNLSWLPQLTIGSFKSERVKTIRSTFPNVITSLTPREILKLKVLSLSSLRTPNLVFAMIPLRFNGFPFLTPALREQLMSRQIPVHAWTINSESDMKLCQDLALDGIVTDEIDQALLMFTK